MLTKSSLKSRAFSVLATAILGASLMGIAPATAADVSVTGLSAGEEATFTTIGDIDVQADGTVSMAELDTIGISRQDIQQIADENVGPAGNKAARVAPMAVATGSYTVMAKWTDNKAKTTLVRRGTSAFGLNHFSAAHGSTINMAIKATKFPKTRVTEGSTIVYVTPANKLVCSMLKCTITATQNVRTVVANQRQSDGLQKGVITIYCVGRTICQSWVVAAAN